MGLIDRYYRWKFNREDLKDFTKKYRAFSLSLTGNAIVIKRKDQKEFQYWTGKHSGSCKSIWLEK